jgi:hypothetical protein
MLSLAGLIGLLHRMHMDTNQTFVRVKPQRAGNGQVVRLGVI